jgi:hypothetical protein
MSGNADEKCRIVDRNEDGNGMIGTQNINGQKEIACSTVYDGKKSSTLKLLKSILSSYVQFIQSPSRQDSILKTVQYSLWLLSKFYRGSGTNKHRQLPHRVAESLLKLQGEISWARYVLRFFGFPAAINDVVDMESGWGTGNNANRIGRVMSWSMVAYYPLEHLSYLLWKGPGIRWLPIVSPTTPMQNPVASTTCPNHEKSRNKRSAYRYSSAQLASKASAWSCRFWLTWIVLDIVRCTLALREIQQTSHQLEETAKSASAANDGLRQSDRVEEEGAESLQHKAMYKETITTVRTEHIRILRHALYVLPAINWSLPEWDTKPWLSGDLVNGLCWVESMIGLYQGIHDYQKT